LSNEPRKATDVLLDLESKIDSLLLMVRNQDLNLKLISNKLNILIEKIEKSEKPELKEKFIVEAIDNSRKLEEEKSIVVDSDFNLQLAENPVGFRRTSRPETYESDDSYLQKEVKFPVQIPKQDVKDFVVDHSKNDPNKQETSFKNYEEKEHINNVSVIQRVVDKNGKSVFLADVEINNDLNQNILKTRTNGTGKWMASLPPGLYSVIIRKRESLTKEKMESIQKINVEQDQSSLDLQTVILR